MLRPSVASDHQTHAQLAVTGCPSPSQDLAVDFLGTGICSGDFDPLVQGNVQACSGLRETNRLPQSTGIEVADVRRDFNLNVIAHENRPHVIAGIHFFKGYRALDMAMFMRQPGPAFRVRHVIAGTDVSRAAGAHDNRVFALILALAFIRRQLDIDAFFLFIANRNSGIAHFNFTPGGHRLIRACFLAAVLDMNFELRNRLVYLGEKLLIPSGIGRLVDHDQRMAGRIGRDKAIVADERLNDGQHIGGVTVHDTDLDDLLRCQCGLPEITNTNGDP